MDTLDVAQAAALLHVHPRRIRALARAGKLPGVQVGRKWLFPRPDLERLLATEKPPEPATNAGLSARNHLRGRISALQIEGLMAEVVVRIGGQELVSVITRSSAKRLGLEVGDEVYAVVKATEVMIAKD
ncbi:MAG TPA: TOBE domain-containing protein [Candidatus Limnocylindria bacterium]|nr:TOBE domain-containing protein [Candidatus Limnocylindria bacterium]